MEAARSLVVSRDARVVAAVLVWIPVVLLLDAGVEVGGQAMLGLGTWALLLLLLRGESRLVRTQVAVVVVFATLVEYTFSPLLETYVYRLDNVPAFVPPGHGLVYLSAYAFGRSTFARAHARALVTTTLVLGAGYAAWGLSPLAPRPDVLGAFWFLCLVGFLAYGRSRLLYVGAFAVVTYLEVLGTAIGTWEWKAYDPTGVVAMGNPPTGAAGGYGWFDLVAVTVAPSLLSAYDRWSARRQPREHLVVDAPVGAEETRALQGR